MFKSRKYSQKRSILNGSLQQCKELLFSYELLLNNIPHRTYLKDTNLIYLLCNKKYAQDLGIKASEIVGTTDYDLFSRKKADSLKRDDLRVIKQGKIKKKIEKHTSPDGRGKYYYYLIVPVKDKQGDIIGILGVYCDQTELIQEQKDLDQAYNKLDKRLRLRTSEMHAAQEKARLAQEKFAKLKQVTEGREIKMIELKLKIENLEKTNKK